MKAKEKRHFMHPVLLQQVEILLENDLLAGSVEKSMDGVITAGQKVDGEYNASSSSFNGSWTFD